MGEQSDPEANGVSQSAPSSNAVGSANVGSTNEPGIRPERRGPPPNPLYHPLFLPTLLILFSLWFGYDGFITADPDMLEHQTFNRVMFFLMFPVCLWMVPRGIKEFREEQANAAKKQTDGKPS